MPLFTRAYDQDVAAGHLCRDDQVAHRAVLGDLLVCVQGRVWDVRGLGRLPLLASFAECVVGVAPCSTL